MRKSESMLDCYLFEQLEWIIFCTIIWKWLSIVDNIMGGVPKRDYGCFRRIQRTSTHNESLSNDITISPGCLNAIRGPGNMSLSFVRVRVIVEACATVVFTKTRCCEVNFRHTISAAREGVDDILLSSVIKLLNTSTAISSRTRRDASKRWLPIV